MGVVPLLIGPEAHLVLEQKARCPLSLVSTRSDWYMNWKYE